MKDHFPGLYCRKTHSLRPRKTTFSHQSWLERHLQREEQRHDVCKSRAAHGNEMKNISKTKDWHGASLASYSLEKVDNKGQWANKTKEYQRQNETKCRTRQKVNTKKYISVNKGMWAWIQWKWLRWTKESQSEDERNRDAKRNKVAGGGLQLLCGTTGSQSEDRGNRGAKQNRAAPGGLELVRGAKQSRIGTKETTVWNKT